MAKRRVHYRYRPRYRRRHSGGMTIPLAPILGLAYSAVPALTQIAGGDTNGGANRLIRGFTGYDMFSHDWGWQRLQEGAMPLVVGLLVHKFIGGKPLNANAMLAKAKVPLIRI